MNGLYFGLLLILVFLPNPAISTSSFTITTDSQFRTFENTNIVVIGTGEEAILLLNNHFEKLLPSVIPPKRHSYSADYSSTIMKLFMFGGVNDESYPWIYYNDCWIFDETSKNWQQINISTTNLPAPRYGHYLVAISTNKFLLFGGLGTQGYFNDTYIFTIEPASCQKIITSTSPPARYYHAMCFAPDENKVYLFGGAYGNNVYNDLWYFDVNTLSWSSITVTSQLPPARLGHKMVYIQPTKKIYIFGGEESLQFNQKKDLWVYDTVSKSFSQIPETTIWPEPISHFGMTVMPEFNQILIFGGYKGNNYSNELWFFNYVSTTFAKANYYSITQIPIERNKFSFIKLKNNFFLFGGTSGFTPLSDTFFYYYTDSGITSGSIFIRDIPTKLVYKTFIFSPQPPPGSDIKFQIAYSTDGINYSEFLGPDGTQNSYFTYTQQNFPQGIFENKRYLKLKGYFSSYNIPVNPYIEEIVINYNLTPHPPQLGRVGNIVSPFNAWRIKTATNTIQPTFSWFQPLDPDGDNIVSYRLQISTTLTFTSTIIDQLGITNTYYKLTTALPTGVYYWRVSAKDEDEGNFSDYYEIEIDTTPPTAPTYFTAKPHLTIDKTIELSVRITGDDLSTGTFRGSVIVAYSSYTIINETNFDTVQKITFSLRDSVGNYLSYIPNYELFFTLENLQNDTTYYIAVKLEDDALNLSSASVCISTITNFIPYIKISSPQEAQEIKGNRINISWQFGDYNTDETTHTFIIYMIDEINNSTITLKSLTNTTYYIWNSLEVRNSTYTLKIQIKDTRGAVFTDEVKNLLVVNENFPPKILSWIRPQKNEIFVGETKISWVLEDPNLADEHLYEIFITTNFDINHKIAEFYNTTEFTFNTNLFPNDTNYYLILKVTDKNGLTDISTSPVFAIKNGNLPPSEPILVVPKHLSYTSPYKVKFEWLPSEDPNINDRIRYDFYLSTSNTMNFFILSKKDIIQTYYEVSYPIIEEEKNYFWKVVAKDIFDTEAHSDVYMFTTYPRFKSISEDNTVYVELLDIPQEKIFVHISKVCTSNERNLHPLISIADRKDKTDRFIKILPFDVYEINLYDENYNKVNRNLEYKIVVYIDSIKYDILTTLLRIAYLNPESIIWEFTDYKQQVSMSNSPSNIHRPAINTISNKFGLYSVLAKNPVVEPISNIIIYPNPFNPKVENVTVEYILTEDLDLKVYILTLSGGLVKEFHFPKGQPGKTKGSPEGQRNSFIWDGRNNKGDFVANGMYICKLVFGNKILYKNIGVIKR
ncbi:MAG: kelch repeat-containing protein [Elusimicrobiota bacterium]|nr:hypothetical protein [Endomicrobiia bacterium]MDW8166204.1 kelch repeat-containing protein [Elusimicrobiota bacterium]